MFMKNNFVRFNRTDQPKFFKELKSKVNDHFRENNLSRHANLTMKLKTAFMIGLYTIPFLLMLTGVAGSIWSILLMWVLMGFGMSGIGLSIMHDANHGSYSRNQKVNKALGFLINFVGGYHVNWKIQHNVLHHSFTNIDGLDEDINKSVLRMSPTQDRKSFHRFQALYAPFLYGIMTIYWFALKDYQQVLRYHKKDLLSYEGLTFKSAMTQIIIHKSWYLLLFLVLPIIVISLPWWVTVLGFLLMHFTSGLILALIFQTAHVIEGTEFFETGDDPNFENSWALHQMKTTSNYAGKSIFFSWFIGGLNYQIEHHLFPNICHVHYKDISKIVKSTAAKFNVQYLEHKTFAGALVSHFSLLHELGTGKYERRLANR